MQCLHSVNEMVFILVNYLLNLNRLKFVYLVNLNLSHIENLVFVTFVDSSLRIGIAVNRHVKR